MYICFIYTYIGTISSSVQQKSTANIENVYDNNSLRGDEKSYHRVSNFVLFVSLSVQCALYIYELVKLLSFYW